MPALEHVLVDCQAMLDRDIGDPMVVLCGAKASSAMTVFGMESFPREWTCPECLEGFDAGLAR